MDSNELFPWWQVFADSAHKDQAHRLARITGLSLANEANRRPGGVASMTLDEAEKFATEADILNADLEYVEAASKSNVITAGSSVPRPLVASELRPELQEEIKEIQKRKKRRKIKVQVDRAKEVAEEEKAAAEGPAAPEERALQEEKLTQEGSAIKEMKAPQRKAPAAAPNPKPEIGYTSADDAAILTPKGENKTWEDIGKIGLRFRYKELMAQNGGDTALAATQEGRAAIEKSTTPAERSVQADSAPKKEALQVEKAVEVEAAAKRQVMQDVEAPQEQQAAKETTKVPGHITSETAETKESINRRARADSVNFIRSRTNSRSGANTPLTLSARDPIQSEPIQTVAEAVERLPSPLQTNENPFPPQDDTEELPTEERRFMRGEKGIFVARGSPNDESEEAPVSQPFTLIGPTLGGSQTTLVEPLPEGTQPNLMGLTSRGAQSTPDISAQHANRLADVALHKPPDAPASRKKKKKTKKKKYDHPEKDMVFIQAARTTERLARYKSPRPIPQEEIRSAAAKATSNIPTRSTIAAQKLRVVRSDAVQDPPPHSAAPAAGGTTPPPDFRNIRWAYATHTEADIQLQKYNIFLFEKLPIIKGAPPPFPEPYHNLSERPPIIVSHATAVNEGPSVHLNGDPGYAGDTLMHVFPGTNRRPDARIHPGHPDYLHGRLLHEYQGAEIATGQSVWRHDREHLDCSHPACNKKVVDTNPDTILCLACGPKTITRYCSIIHLIEDLDSHWKDCGSEAMLIKRVIDHNTMPPRFWNHCPAIPNIHGYYSLDRYRQRAYAMMTAGQYTLMNYSTTKRPVVLTWPTSDPNHIEMSSRVARVLNILLFDHKQEILLNYFFRLVRQMCKKLGIYDDEVRNSLAVQFGTEFEWNIHKISKDVRRPDMVRRAAYLRPFCDMDWDGDSRFHIPSSECVKGFEMFYHCGELLHHAHGKGVKSIVEAYEAKYWVLRAWRQRHECRSWRQRAENTGDVKFPNVKVPEHYPHPYLGEGYEGWGAPDDDMREVWGDHTPIRREGGER